MSDIFSTITPNGSQHFDSSIINPITLFNDWLKQAEKTEQNDANAMALATVDSNGLPNVRIVLLKAVDESGFVFYTNYQSQKGVEISDNPKAALCFHWKSVRRQIRIRGLTEQVSKEDADQYFNSRPRASRIGAWASQQSRPLESRSILEEALIFQTKKYATGAVPRPPYWSGFRIRPLTIEFWQDQPFRLHDRLVFHRDDLAQAWQQNRLYP